ncbi:WD40 repeat domain-containing protein [Streptomyces sp. NPDC026673]|uniref:WD40 repeat domain-containing protein n=1 Tax=Streptomyces sp. NPDC026673 TaxID=3155724 RepID=UPI0034006AFA
MTDPVDDDGAAGGQAAVRAMGPGTGWRVEWATGGRIAGAVEAADGHADWVRSATTAVVDGRAVAITGGDDETALVRDLAGGERLGDPLPAQGSVWAVAAVVVDGRTVAAVADPSGLTRAWDLTSRRPLAGLAGGAWAAASAVVDGRPVILLGGDAPRLLMWDAATGESLGELVGAPGAGRVGAVGAVATAEVGGRPVAVTLHDDSVLHTWSLRERRHQGRLLTPAGGSGQRVSLTTAVVDGRLVAVTGTWDGRVQVWDAAAGTEVAGRARLTAHMGPVWAVAAAVVDGRPLVVTGGEDRTVRVWDLVSHRQLGSDAVFPSEVTAVSMAPDGRVVVGFGHDVAVLVPRPD